MASIADCCRPCDTVPPTQIPGAPGTNGATGSAGTAGGNAWTFLTVANVVPAAAGAQLTYQVGDSRWAGIGQTVVFSGPTLADGVSHYTVVSKPSSSSIELLWLDTNGDAVATTAIPIGAQLSPAGVAGTVGGISGGAGSPEGVVAVTGPAVYVEDMVTPVTGTPGLWVKPNGVVGNTGWIEMIAAT